MIEQSFQPESKLPEIPMLGTFFRSTPLPRDVLIRALSIGCRVAAAGLLLLLRPALAQQATVPVSASPVLQREVASGQTFVGTVMPRRRATIGSAVDGRVITFAVNEGDRVEKGQPLAQLLTETLEIQIAAAEAELLLRKEELAELENGSLPEEIEQAEARKLRTKASHDYWAKKLQRYQDLFDKGQSVSREELEETRSNTDQAFQAFAEAQAAWKLVVDGPRKEKVAQAKARMLSQAEEVRRLNDQLAKHTVRARFDGYIVAEHTEVGEWVSRGDPVVELAELDVVHVQVPVLEDYVRHLRLGLETRVELGAVPDRQFTGQVALIVPQADVRSRSFPVKVQVANEQLGGSVLLKAGMFARVTLPLGTVAQALLVPKDALVLGQRTPMVWVVDGGPQTTEGAVRPVPVQLGVSDGGLIQVSGDLKKGERVVVHGNERLRPGAKVAITQVIQPQRGSQPRTPGVVGNAEQPLPSSQDAGR